VPAAEAVGCEKEPELGFFVGRDVGTVDDRARATQQREPALVGPPEETILCCPVGDEPDLQPEISIVVPALNEQITIGEFVDWCKEGLRRVGVSGEVLIVDSSTDQTAVIALEHGARVLRTRKRGLGRAYIDAIPFIRGRFVIMGDCDLTYDFRELRPFVECLRAGFEFVMGSRFQGVIEPRAMPALHRYFGNPVTTLAFNLVHATKYSDIHCGMRGITLELLRRINLTSQGWEYASEMIAKAEALGAKSTNVPISFFKDREGRQSHVKRSGWLTPWRAGWRTLRIILTFRAERVLVPVAMISLVAGIALSALLGHGPVRIVPGMTWTLHALYFGVTLTICGVALLHFSILAAVINDRMNGVALRWVRRFPYTPSIALGFAAVVAGLAPAILLVVRYAAHGWYLTSQDVAISHLSTVGLGLIIVGVLHISFTLLLHSLLDRLYHL